MTSQKDQSCDPRVGVQRQVPRVRQSVSFAIVFLCVSFGICYPLYLDKKLAEVLKLRQGRAQALFYAGLTFGPSVQKVPA